MHARFEIGKCILSLLLVLALLFPAASCAASPEVPDFSKEAAVELNRNVPAFSPEELAAEATVVYSPLDALGRPGPAFACISRESLASAPRAEGGSFLPVGWQTARYDELLSGRNLYSLCCLLSPALGGSDAAPENVFTGTGFLRSEGMQPYEDLIADFLARTAYHVLYRVTPVYRGDELVARGVQMEASSVEDAGRSLRFNVFVHNVQPGVQIDYRSGLSGADPLVEVERSAQELIDSHRLPPLAAMVPPTVGSFSALGGAKTDASSGSDATSSKKQQSGSSGTSTKTTTSSASASTVTTGQKNALNAAKSYLNSSGFSRSGLIEQLVYDGYTDSEAAYAADACGADWEKQALRAAKSYLNSSAFSRSGLIEQLAYDGYTDSEAEYGADASGADWGKQALRAAKAYLESSGFSWSGLYEQLLYDGFGDFEAEYGVEQTNVDWDEQAERAATAYYESSGLTGDALIEQLEYDGFTHDQAVFGAESVGE